MPRGRVVIEFANRTPYDVRIGEGLVAELGRDLRALGVAADRCLVVCDAESAARCLPAVKEPLRQSGFTVSDITIPTVEPDDAWACVGELHRAFSQLQLPRGCPIVVCACVQASELAAFAVATCGDPHPLVVVPASLAAALRLAGVDALELDAGYAFPLVAPVRPAHVMVDAALIECVNGEEAAFGLDELAAAASWCDDEFRRWWDENGAAIAAGDADVLTLALMQVVASRADAIGASL